MFVADTVSESRGNKPGASLTIRSVSSSPRIKVTTRTNFTRLLGGTREDDDAAVNWQLKSATQPRAYSAWQVALVAVEKELGCLPGHYLTVRH
jgi:hypothetical protein